MALLERNRKRLNPVAYLEMDVSQKIVPSSYSSQKVIVDYHHRIRDGCSYRVRKGHSDNRLAIVGRSCGMGQKNSEVEMGWAAEKGYPGRA